MLSFLAFSCKFVCFFFRATIIMANKAVYYYYNDHLKDLIIKILSIKFDYWHITWADYYPRRQ